MKLVWANGCPKPLELDEQALMQAVGRELVRLRCWPPGWNPEVVMRSVGGKFSAHVTWVAAPPEPGEAKSHGGRPPIE